MKIRLELEQDDYDGLIELLHTCADCEDIFIVDHVIAEAVLKQLEEVNY
jgi:hypothetical protein